MEGFFPCTFPLSSSLFGSLRRARAPKLDLLIQILLCGVRFIPSALSAASKYVPSLPSLLQLFDALWRLHTTSKLVWHSLSVCEYWEPARLIREGESPGHCVHIAMGEWWMSKCRFLGYNSSRLVISIFQMVCVTELTVMLNGPQMKLINNLLKCHSNIIDEVNPNGSRLNDNVRSSGDESSEFTMDPEMAITPEPSTNQNIRNAVNSSSQSDDCSRGFPCTKPVYRITANT